MLLLIFGHLVERDIRDVENAGCLIIRCACKMLQNVAMQLTDLFRRHAMVYDIEEAISPHGIADSSSEFRPAFGRREL